jgi:hypothetical protein
LRLAKARIRAREISERSSVRLRPRLRQPSQITRRRRDRTRLGSCRSPVHHPGRLGRPVSPPDRDRSECAGR